MDQGPRRVVVPFEPGHAEAVTAMMAELAAFHDEEAAATVADVARYASGPGRISTIMVASLDGVLCGFMASYEWMNYVQGFPVRHIDLLFVRESVRRRGVGRALLEAAARDARRAGCRRVTIGAEPDNEGANAFYRRMGCELRRPASHRYALAGAALERLAT